MHQSPPVTTQKAYEFYEGSKLMRNPRIRQVPRFDFHDLPETERLRYKLMTWDNFKNYLLLFENDPNPYVMEDFKTLEGLEIYAVNILEYNRFSFKHGGCDWFLRFKTTGELVGVLHIYDLNWELIDGKHPACLFVLKLWN
jgi:hypothetical protein